DRSAVQNQLGAGVLIGQAHHILAIGHALVNAAGALADLAVHVGKQIADILPGLLVLIAAHGQQHIGQVREGRRRVGGVGGGDLALQLGVQQILVALNLDVPDQVGIHNQNAAVQNVAGDEAA